MRKNLRQADAGAFAGIVSVLSRSEGAAACAFFCKGAARRAITPRKSKFVLNIFVLRGAVPEMRRRVI